MQNKFGLYSKINEFLFYTYDALTPTDVIRETKIASTCKIFNRHKKTKRE